MISIWCFSVTRSKGYFRRKKALVTRPIGLSLNAIYRLTYSVSKPNNLLSIYINIYFILNLWMEKMSNILFHCRAKLMDLCVQIVSLLQSHCLLNLTRVYNVVGKQISYVYQYHVCVWYMCTVNGRKIFLRNRCILPSSVYSF